MPYFDFNIEENISVDEFLSSCDDSEIKELIQALMIQSLKHNSDRLDNNFDAAVGKLIGNAWRLSKEDEETILKIANKIVA
jgi:thioredoxin-like negative regulator of GroEL